MKSLSHHDIKIMANCIHLLFFGDYHYYDPLLEKQDRIHITVNMSYNQQIGFRLSSHLCLSLKLAYTRNIYLAIYTQYRRCISVFVNKEVEMGEGEMARGCRKAEII